MKKMKTKVKAKKTKSIKVVVKKHKPLKRTKKVASLAKGVDVVENPDGTYRISGKNAKELEGALVERRERQYKFDDRLVPYYCGSATREGNTEIRKALVELGKTKQMTDLFLAIKDGGIAYNEDGKEVFIKVLYSIINGHDCIGLANIYDDDIVEIEKNNYKTFDDFFKPKTVEPDEFEGFSK